MKPRESGPTPARPDPDQARDIGILSVMHGEVTEEFTVDELASRAEMTVRNVRAYASRGLIPPPRLEGRTGLYTLEHLQRLRLVRQLLARGFTLAAVEDALLRSPKAAPGMALDLLNILEPVDFDPETKELMSRRDLAALASIREDHPVFEQLVALGLLEVIDNETFNVSLPSVVRLGTAAMAQGINTDTVVSWVPLLREHLWAIADDMVTKVSAEVIDPFVDLGLPQDEWPQVFETIENLLRIASQTVAAMFRAQMSEAVEIEIGKKLHEMAANGLDVPDIRSLNG